MFETRSNNRCRNDGVESIEKYGVISTGLKLSLGLFKSLFLVRVLPKCHSLNGTDVIEAGSKHVL